MPTWLADAGIGAGRHGFRLHLPHGLSAAAHVVAPSAAPSDGAMLPGSPRAVPAEPCRDAREPVADPAGPDAVARLSAGIAAAAAGASRPQLEVLIGELARQAAALLFTAGAEPIPRRPCWHAGGRRPISIRICPPVRRALFIDETVPDTGRDAGSAAAMSHMRALRRLGWEVHFVALAMSPRPARIRRRRWPRSA